MIASPSREPRHLSDVHWPGNAAKSRVIRDLLARGARRVFDHGCGAGGAWPAILAAHPDLELIGWDPDRAALSRARERLAGRRVRIVDTIPALVEADAIVSLSVLEHVHDRTGYLALAKRHLAPDGTFYLNYDDGHFRVAFDVDRPALWPAQVRLWVHNQLARLGRRRDYQRRVTRTEADRLVAAAGFGVADVWYGNVAALKELSKTIPPERAKEFQAFWLDVETRLGAFAAAGRSERGDSTNLWSIMPSRTLVLRHA